MRRRPPPPAPTTAGPTEAPPTPREEHQAARAGFLWIPGKWDWKRKWEWTAGHWERERAGKQWRGGHWDRNGASWSWTEGEWIDAGAAMPPPVNDHHDGDHHDGDHHDGDHHDGDHHDGDHHDGHDGTLPPPPNDHHPHQAPPPPRSETPSMKAGFIWVPGRWDWKNDQWAWADGHWERERAGRKWRPAQWQNQSNTWVLVDGDWIDASAPMPPDGAGMQPPPPMPGNTGIVPPHHWKVDRPTVSSYWPDKGKAGSRVIVRGRNFSQETRVMWGPDEVRAAKVHDDEIEFRVPDNATSATILLKGAGGRDLIVGNFEVANYDADADAKRIEAERQAAAQAAWTASQSRMAKDGAARQAALDQHWNELDSNREQRRQQRVQEIRAKWQAAFLGDPDTQDELTMHAERVAELTRAKDVAGVTNNQKLGIRIDIALAKETDRHGQRMASLQTAFSAKGGH